MCGIVGLISKERQGFWQGHASIFEEMLLCDAIRGGDSTGVFGLLRNTQVRLLKNATHAGIFIQDKRWEAFKSLMIQQMFGVVGHNRAATRGEIKNENAHPFHKEHIILVHNGTLTNHKTIADTDVDSEAIVHGFVNQGIKETLRQLEGAWALVWYDMKEKKLFLARNSERPLALAENASLLAFASEGHMLSWILNRDNRPITKDIKIIPAETLISISLNPFEVISEDLKVVVVSSHPPFLPVVANTPEVIETKPLTHTITPDEYVEGKVFDAYPKGAQVIFMPTSCEVSERHPKKRIRAEGVAYIPGKPIASCSCWFPEDVPLEDAASMCSEKKLVATISTTSYNAAIKELHLMVINPKTDNWVDTWTNQDYLCTEWEMLCKNLLCSKCKDVIVQRSPEFTSVRRIKNTEMVESVTCDTCVLSNYDKMPKTVQERVDARLASGNSAL